MPPAWNLGASDDPGRGLAVDTKLASGEVIHCHRLRDWRWSLVMDGDLTLGRRHLGVGDIVITEPEVVVPDAVAGPNGAQLLELCRTAAAEPRVFEPVS